MMGVNFRASKVGYLTSKVKIETHYIYIFKSPDLNQLSGWRFISRKKTYFKSQLPFVNDAGRPFKINRHNIKRNNVEVRNLKNFSKIRTRSAKIAMNKLLDVSSGLCCQFQTKKTTRWVHWGVKVEMSELVNWDWLCAHFINGPIPGCIRSPVQDTNWSLLLKLNIFDGVQVLQIWALEGGRYAQREIAFLLLIFTVL